MKPQVSYVIPIHNEEAILRAAIVDLRDRLSDRSFSYEVLLAENGSTDETVSVATELARKYPEVRWFSTPTPNYGAALREGIQRAVGDYVICEEIDLCDVDFHVGALALLESGAAEFVVGSKLVAGANDQRPLTRHVASLGYNALLRVLLNYPGTDTHGLKAFRRTAVLQVVERCVVDRDVFASELVIRAHREGLIVKEIPVRVMEKRVPSINLLSRIPHVLRSLTKLTIAIRTR